MVLAIVEELLRLFGSHATADGRAASALSFQGLGATSRDHDVSTTHNNTAATQPPQKQFGTSHDKSTKRSQLVFPESSPDRTPYPPSSISDTVQQLPNPVDILHLPTLPPQSDNSLCADKPDNACTDGVGSPSSCHALDQQDDRKFDDETASTDGEGSPDDEVAATCSEGSSLSHHEHQQGDREGSNEETASSSNVTRPLRRWLYTSPDESTKRARFHSPERNPTPPDPVASMQPLFLFENILSDDAAAISSGESSSTSSTDLSRNPSPPPSLVVENGTAMQPSQPPSRSPTPPRRRWSDNSDYDNEPDGEALDHQDDREVDVGPLPLFLPNFLPQGTKPTLVTLFSLSRRN